MVLARHSNLGRDYNYSMWLAKKRSRETTIVTRSVALVFTASTVTFACDSENAKCVLAAADPAALATAAVLAAQVDAVVLVDAAAAVGHQNQNYYHHQN
jgi:hypothetical protein